MKLGMFFIVLGFAFPLARGHQLPKTRPDAQLNAAKLESLLAITNTLNSKKKLTPSQEKQLEDIVKDLPSGCLLPDHEDTVETAFFRYGRLPCDVTLFKKPIEITFIGEFHGTEADEARKPFQEKAKNKKAYVVEEGCDERIPPFLVDANEGYVKALTGIMRGFLAAHLRSISETDEKDYSAEFRSVFADLSHYAVMTRLMEPALKAMIVPVPRPSDDALKEMRLLYSAMASSKLSGKEKGEIVSKYRKITEQNSAFSKELMRQLARDLITDAQSKEAKFKYLTPNLGAVEEHLKDPTSAKKFDAAWDIVTPWRDQMMYRKLARTICASGSDQKPINFIACIDHIPGGYEFTKRFLESSQPPGGFQLSVDKSILKSKQFLEGLKEKSPETLRQKAFYDSIL